MIVVCPEADGVKVAVYIFDDVLLKLDKDPLVTVISACAKLDEPSLNVNINAMEASELEAPEVTVEDVIVILGVEISVA